MTDERAARLLCIDLQIDARRGLQPDPRAVFGARQLLAVGRALGWSIAHTRLRGAVSGEAWMGGLRPLLSEPVFQRSARPITASPGLVSLLDDWRDEPVYVAAFDPVSLLSCLVECCDRGPRFILVEDALAVGASRPAVEACRTAASMLAGRTTTIPAILSNRPRVTPLRPPAPLQASWR
jgi:hypothetical protein